MEMTMLTQSIQVFIDSDNTESSLDGECIRQTLALAAIS